MEVLYQLILAMILGALLGLEREYRKREAGLRTYSLVALGACCFTILSFEIVQPYLSKPGVNVDLIRIIQAIAIGVGFIGAGAIFHQPSGIMGLTTAAGLWITAAIGIAVGAKLYFLSIVTTILTLVILIGFGKIEEKVFKK